MIDQGRTGLPCRYGCRDKATGHDTIFRATDGTVAALIASREARDVHEVASHGELFAKPYVAVPLGFAIRPRKK